MKLYAILEAFPNSTCKFRKLYFVSRICKSYLLKQTLKLLSKAEPSQSGKISTFNLVVIDSFYAIYIS